MSSVCRRVRGIEPFVCSCPLERNASDWIECHLLAFETFGGAPALHPWQCQGGGEQGVPFCPKVNRTYAGMAVQYGSVVLPTPRAALQSWRLCA
jgi:hypothetical protein